MTIDNLNQLRQWQPPYRPDAIIDEGLLLPGTVMMLFGAAGTWKTMSSAHIAFCIATGVPWFGFKTQPATVLAHQVELPKLLFKNRIIKYADGNKKATQNIFFQTPQDEVLLDTTMGTSALAKSVEEVKRRAADPALPVVVILDPLYMHMAGHISDEYDTRKFQRNVNELRRNYDLTFIIIHHSRLTRVDNTGAVVDLGAEEIMGSSYWNNWLDTILRVKVTNPFNGSDTIQNQFGKTRNADSFVPGFTVHWDRSCLRPEVIDREIYVEDEPSVRDLT